MKIAFIGQKGIPTLHGGVERHVEELALCLVSRGCEVIVYTRPHYTDRDVKEYKGIKLVNIPTIATKHLDAITHSLFSCFDVRRQKVDVIHFHSIGPSFWIWLAKLLNPRTPIVATFHSQCYKHRKWSTFAKLSLKLGENVCCLASDSLITVSRNLKEFVLRKYRINAKYIPNGVPRYQRVDLDLAKKWKLEEEGYILFAGRLVENKGVHYLIEAYNQIRTDKKLVIVGGGFKGDNYERRLKKMAKGNENIIFTGNLRGNSKVLAELFSNSYFFAHPSEMEGLSIALLETMSYGRAPLVSDIPENIEAVRSAGFLFENKNVADLKRNIVKLLRDFHEVKRKGILGKIRVQKCYGWKAITNDVLAVYRDAIERERAKKTYFPRGAYLKNVLEKTF